jgi:hypothetical protein
MLKWTEIAWIIVTSSCIMFPCAACSVAMLHAGFSYQVIRNICVSVAWTCVLFGPDLDRPLLKACGWSWSGSVEEQGLLLEKNNKPTWMMPRSPYTTLQPGWDSFCWNHTAILSVVMHSDWISVRYLYLWVPFLSGLWERAWCTWLDFIWWELINHHASLKLVRIFSFVRCMSQQTTDKKTPGSLTSTSPSVEAMKCQHAVRCSDWRTLKPQSSLFLRCSRTKHAGISRDLAPSSVSTSSLLYTATYVHVATKPRPNSQLTHPSWM